MQKQSLNRLDVVDYISHGQKKEENFSYIDQKENEESIVKNDGDSQIFLDKYCINLNEKAEKEEIDPIIGRDNRYSEQFISYQEEIKITLFLLVIQV